MTPSEALAAMRSAMPVLLAHGEYQADNKLRQLKARFWQLFNSNPLVDVKDITPALAEDLLGKSLKGHLSDPRFWPWFSTKDSAKQNLEVCAERATELALYYLDPAIPLQDSARINLIKIVLEFSGRTPPARKEIKWQDREIGDLSQEDLDAFIQKEVDRQVRVARKKDKTTLPESTSSS